MNRRLCRLDDVAVGNVNHYPRQQLTHLRFLPPHTHTHTHAAGRMTFAHLDSRPPDTGASIVGGLGEQSPTFLNEGGG